MASSPDRPAVIAAWVDGWRRVLSAPALLAGALLLTAAAAVPLALTLRADLAAHLRTSTVADTVARGVDTGWWQEFTAQASGLGTTFTPRIVGFAATLDSLSALADTRRPAVALAGVAAVYLAAWTWLIGGIVDRYARQRPTFSHGFGAAGMVNFWRLLRLAGISGLLYGWIVGYLQPWLLDEKLQAWTRGLEHERTAFLARLGAYAVVWGLVVAVNLVFDYAKIRLVVEDRQSALGGTLAALRFVRRHARSAAGLYALNALTFVLLVAAWALVAPGASGGQLWAGIVLGQLFIVARLASKLHFLASQTSLFQAGLAHAGYTAAPARAHSESPAVESLH